VGLSPEERIKIYEEEKARIEAEQQQKTASGSSTTGLKPNVAGLLCYLAGWVTGIIFLVIEQKNRFVRFHAIQSIIVFGALTVASTLLTHIPFVGGFFGTVIGLLIFILWIVLMVKAHQGQWYKIPVAGDIAEKALPLPETIAEEKPGGVEEKEPTEPAPLKPDLTRSGQAQKIEHRMDSHFTNTRTARITSSSLSIAWSFILLIFFSFFHGYIAYYAPETMGGITTWTRTPLLTTDYYAWLPILVTILILSIVGHSFLIVYDRYWSRQIILIILNVLGITTVASLLSIFPFNFYVLPNSTVADIVSIGVRIALIAIAVGLGIGSLVMLIKLITSLVRATSE